MYSCFCLYIFRFLITGSKAAGDRLASMLKLGSSVPWKEAMEVMTGTAGMDTSAFRSYFKPLEDWLIQENEKNGVKIGWKVDDYEKYCKSSAV